MADLGSGTSLPSSPPANPGDTFFDENTATSKVYNGSAWVPLGGGTSGAGSTGTTPQASTSTPSSVAVSATSVTFLNANPARKGYSVYNESSEQLYLAEAASASVTSYKVQIIPNGYYESTSTVYTGKVTGIWASADSGHARIVELT